MPPEVEPDERLRVVLEKLEAAYGRQWLHASLGRLDPAAAERIDPRNTRRTIRALEVILRTGRRFSDQRRRGESPYSILSLGLTRPRPELYARIDARIRSMFESGLLDEARALLRRGYSPDLPSLSAIGYREAVRVINGEWTAGQAQAAMQRATRAFVRRQSNWFKLSDPSIHWFEAGEAESLSRMLALIRQWLIDF
jgi:tRNA dimethylallyltransferase